MLSVATLQGRKLRSCKENWYFNTKVDSDAIYTDTYTPATMWNNIIQVKIVSQDTVACKINQNLTLYIPYASLWLLQQYTEVQMQPALLQTPEWA